MRRHSPSVSVSLFLATTLTATAQPIAGVARFLTQNSVTSHVPCKIAIACKPRSHSLDNHTTWEGSQWDDPISCQQHQRNIACPSPIGPTNPHWYSVQGSIPSPRRDHGSGFCCQQTPSQRTGARPKCEHCSHPRQQFSHQHQQVCWRWIHRHLWRQRGQLLQEGHHQDHCVGGCSATGLVMPTWRIVACPTCSQCSKLKHGHNPTRLPSRPLESPRNVWGHQHDSHSPAYLWKTNPGSGKIIFVCRSN